MKGTFTSTVNGRVFSDISDRTGYIRGGTGKQAVLVLDIASGSVDLEASQDEGTTWIVDSSYTSDTVKKVDLLGENVIYTLNGTYSANDIPYTLAD